MDRIKIARGVYSITIRFVTMAAFLCVLTGLSIITAFASSLTPPGAPAPTMRSVEQLKPSWDKILLLTIQLQSNNNSKEMK